MAEYSPREVSEEGCLQRLQNQASQHHLQHYACWLPHLVLALGLPTSSYSRSRSSQALASLSLTLLPQHLYSGCGHHSPAGGAGQSKNCWSYIDLVPKCLVSGGHQYAWWSRQGQVFRIGMGVVAHVSSDGHMRMDNTEMYGLPICNQFQAKDFQMFLMRLSVLSETCNHLLHRPNTLQCV